MKKVIAIIDDDNILLEMLKNVLEDEGYTVHTYSHTVFIDVLEKENYDLLLLDVWFDTYRSGIEMAQAVRNRSSLQKKPIIMMSSDPNLEEYAYRAGVKKYVSKPINFDSLFEIIKDMLKPARIKPLSQEIEAYTQTRGQI